MSDVEYFLLEKDGENSKCGVLDLGKCMDSDENSAEESRFPKESDVDLQHNLPAGGESLEENGRENNTTNLVGHTQVSKDSDDQLLSFISTEESRSDVNPNRDAQIEKDMNVSKSPDNVLKDFIDMNVGVGLSTGSLHGNGVNPEEKSETSIPKQTLTDESHASSVANTNPHSTKIQDDPVDTQANSKSLTEILDDFCSEPPEIISASEMSFSALVESDEKEKTGTPNNLPVLQNQEVEMTEIWPEESTEEVTENGALRQAVKGEESKESNEDEDGEESSTDAIHEGIMETEEVEADPTESSEDTNETRESEGDHIGSSAKSEENGEMFVDDNEMEEKEMDATEETEVNEENEEEMETVENEVEDKKTEEEDTSGQDEAGDNEMLDRHEEMEANEADDDKTEERGLESISKDAVESEVEDIEMETEEKDYEKESVDEELKGKDAETQEKDIDVEEGNSVDSERSQGIEDSDWDEGRENMKKTDVISEDTESDLADDDTNSQEKSVNLIDKERNADTFINNEKSTENIIDIENNTDTLIDKERNMDNEKENSRLEDLDDEEEDSQDENLEEIVRKDDAENLKQESSEVLERDDKESLKHQPSEESDSQENLEYQSSELMERDCEENLEHQSSDVVERDDEENLECQSSDLVERDGKENLDSQSSEELDHEENLVHQSSKLMEEDGKENSEHQSSEFMERDHEENLEDQLSEPMERDGEENLEDQSSDLRNSKESETENIDTITNTDKDSSEETNEESSDQLEETEDVKNSEAKNKDQNVVSKETSVKIQMLSRSSEVLVESEANSSEKSPNKETELSETEKEIFEGSKPKSPERVVEPEQTLPQKSSVAVSPAKKLKVSDADACIPPSDSQNNADDDFVDYDEESIENISKTIKSFTTGSSLDKKHDRRTDSNQKTDPSQSKQVIMVKTSSNVERVKRKLEEILEKSKGEEDAAIAELQRMKKEKTDILNAITTEMEKLKSILVKGKQG